MGTGMMAFVEYCGPPVDPEEPDSERAAKAAPFSGEVVSVSEDEGLFTGSKAYLLFGAVTGYRNTTGIEPLIAPRGLPAPPTSVQLRMAVGRSRCWGCNPR